MFSIEDIGAFVTSKRAAAQSPTKIAAHGRLARAKPRKGHTPSFMMPTLSTLEKQAADGDAGYAPQAVSENLAESKSPEPSSPSRHAAIGAFSSIQSASPEYVNKYSRHSPSVAQRNPQAPLVSDETSEASPPAAWACAPIRLQSNMPNYDSQELYDRPFVQYEPAPVEKEKPLPPAVPRPVNARKKGQVHKQPDATSSTSSPSTRRYEVEKADFSTFSDEPDGEMPKLLPIVSSSLTEAAKQVSMAMEEENHHRRSSLMPPKTEHGVGGQAALEDLRREMQAQADKVLQLQTALAAKKLREQLQVEEQESDKTASKVQGYRSSFTVETSAKTSESLQEPSALQPSLQSPESAKARKMLEGVGKALQAIEQGPIKRLQLAKDDESRAFLEFMADVHGFGSSIQPESQGPAGWGFLPGASQTAPPWANKHASISAMLSSAQRYTEQPAQARQAPPAATTPTKARESQESANRSPQPAALQHRFESPLAQSKEHDRAVEMVRKTARDALEAALQRAVSPAAVATTGVASRPQAPHSASESHNSFLQRAQSPPRPKSMRSSGSPGTTRSPPPRPRQHPPPSAVLAPSEWKPL